jgi:molybdenum cofactor cytidylyltransferase
MGGVVCGVTAGVTIIQSKRPPAGRRRSELMRVAGVVLAAGGSTRFGKPKQFALFQGETFIRRIAAAAIEAGCAPVVVVTGEDSAQVTLELTGLAVSIAINPRWPSGLGSSIGVGVQRAIDLVADLDASLLLTCDQPFVSAPVLAQIIQLRLTSAKPIVASAYATTLGIPALFDRSCFPDLLRLEGDSGAKKIILARPHDVVPFDFPAGEIDIDTATDYEKLDQAFTAHATCRTRIATM